MNGLICNFPSFKVVLKRGGVARGPVAAARAEAREVDVTAQVVVLENRVDEVSRRASTAEEVQRQTVAERATSHEALSPALARAQQAHQVSQRELEASRREAEGGHDAL